MPDPQALKIGDRVRFVAIPEEWSQPGYRVSAASRRFMAKMLRRSWPSRVVEIDEFGTPWISARIRERGKLRLHTWAILESTGWRRVERRH
jgi:hypothetical protein